jgi:hypothetical protein
MTYREQLDKARETGLDIIDLTIADECESNFGFVYTEKEFEQLCEYVRVCYIKGDCSASSICTAINYYAIDKGKTVAEIVKMSYWRILDEAQWH